MLHRYVSRPPRKSSLAAQEQRRLSEQPSLRMHLCYEESERQGQLLTPSQSSRESKRDFVLWIRCSARTDLVGALSIHVSSSCPRVERSSACRIEQLAAE